MSEPVLDSAIRVFLFIENRLLREALNRLCRKRADLHVVGEAGFDNCVPSGFFESHCDVLALDFFNPNLLSSLSRARPGEGQEFKTVLIGMEDDSPLFLEAVRAGVFGFLLKDASASDVIAAIRAVFKREAVCPPRLLASLFERYAKCARSEQDGTPSAASDLTLRQRQLVNLVAKGLTNKEIAAQLNLSEFTVRNHLHRIMKQVDAGSRQEVVRVVREQVLAVTL